jgi:hypothetical protein
MHLLGDLTIGGIGILGRLDGESDAARIGLDDAEAEARGVQTSPHRER